MPRGFLIGLGLLAAAITFMLQEMEIAAVICFVCGNFALIASWRRDSPNKR